MIGETPDHRRRACRAVRPACRARRGSRRSRRPGWTARSAPASAPAMASRRRGQHGSPRRPRRGEPVRGQLAPGAGSTTPGSAGPSCASGPLAGSSTTTWVSTRSSGHRQQRDAGLPAVAQRGGDVGERVTGVAASGCGSGGWRCPGRRGENQRRLGAVARRARRDTVQVSSARPQPRSVSMPPPRVYMQESRSGQICRPCSRMSSPTLTTAVTSTSGSSRTPSRKRAPPTPPTSTVILTRPSLRSRSTAADRDRAAGHIAR